MLNRPLQRARIAYERALRPFHHRPVHRKRSMPSPGSTRRIAALHYWDTRARFRDTWVLNGRIVAHNLLQIEAKASPGHEVRHFITLHEVTEQPAVEDLIARLKERHRLEVLRVRMDLEGIQHPHKMTYVVRESLGRLETALSAYDHVFMLPQDTLIVNHLDRNFLEVLIDVAEGVRDPAGLTFPEMPGNGYVSHTVGAAPEWRHLSHNGAFGRGLFHRRLLDHVVTAARRSRDWITAERYMSEVLGQRCAYLRPHERFYFGDYPMEELTPERVETLLRLSRDVAGTRKIMAMASRHWAGGLRPPWEAIG